MSLLFISDLHLHPSRPEVTQAFYRFLSTHQTNTIEALYILGDFFEAWLGDDDDTPMYHKVIQRLHDYSQQGIPVYFMHGNRDFLIGERFAQAANVTLLTDPTVITYNDESYLLMHGDSLCTKDSDYMAFRQMTRTAEWQQKILSLSLDERRSYASSLRKTSQSMTSLKADDILDVTPEDVVKVMGEYNVRTLIHGHTHRPNTHTLTVNGSPAKRIVLGDWGRYGWYLILSEKTPSLERFLI
ncbi:MAG: UDP-2,3-diacylglucosamine hydrolase [Candidatus Endobugula sp.]|jgi:UDP-2,3-diacylglucosamine hydrolase